MLPDREAASRRVSPRAWRWLRLLVSITLLVFLLYHLESEQTLGIIADAKFGLVALTVALLFGDRLFAAYRWHQLLHGLDPRIAYSGVLRLSLVSSFVGVFMPGGVDLVRIYGLGRTAAGLPLAFTSVLVERLQSLVALLALMLIGLAVAPIELPGAVGRTAWLGLLLLGAGVGMSMYPPTRRLARFLLPGQWLAPVRAYLDKVFACLDAYRDRPVLIGWTSLVAVTFQLFRIATVLIAGWAVGLDLSFLVLMALMPIVFVVSLLPISIAGGFGVREVGFVVLLAFAGIEAEAAFAMALLLSVGGILTVLPGAWIYLRAGVVTSAGSAAAADLSIKPSR